MGWLAPNAKLRSPVAPVRMSWARVLKRVFDIDIGRLRVRGQAEEDRRY